MVPSQSSARTNQENQLQKHIKLSFHIELLKVPGLRHLVPQKSVRESLQSDIQEETDSFQEL